jgi:Zn-dependent protease with chaperone function
MELTVPVTDCTSALTDTKETPSAPAISLHSDISVTEPGRPPINIGDLRDPRETTAKGFLIALAVPAWLLIILWIISSLGIVLIFIGLFALFGYLARLFSMAYIKTYAIKTSEQQFSEIHQASVKICEQLHIEPPDVYLMQNTIWNAFATKLAGNRIVVLLSGAVDAILLKGDMPQLAWLVGHEIGHHAAGHIGVWHSMIMMGGWLPWFSLWYRRRGELTCDRIGLYAAGDVSSSIKAMCNMTVGAQLAEHVNIQETINQWEKHKKEWFVRYRVLYSTHPPNLFRIKRLVDSAHELGFRV